ncbi:hypothetical protein [Mesoplasma melaleucae]|uniref:hypothetical protein n=1 Tax=Mesoplasma melaleucae TaxID=81459 RepID=UPI0004883346|nr:hypothetical protein [Mesoplasma melaleucae]
MQVFGLENSLPVELPKISLKQIIDLQSTKTMKLSDLLKTWTKGLSHVIALLAKGVAPKLSNIANEFNNTSLTQDSEFKLVKGDSTSVKISDLVTSDLLLGESDAQYTYLLALATKLFDEKKYWH